MTAAEREWIRGAAWALAEIEDSPSGGTNVEEALAAAGLTTRKLRAAGVEGYDIDWLRGALRRNVRRERQQRAAREKEESRG